jgi:hypothetical protein
MRILSIVTLVIAGCSVTNSSTRGTYSRSAELTGKSQEISEREHQCIRAAVIRTNDQIARIASTSNPKADGGFRIQMVAKDRDAAKCKAAAEREKDELSASERAEYLRQAEQERQHKSLMSILTTSLSR